jgi:hypothetical protein
MTGFLDIPSPWVLLSNATSEGVEPEVIIKLVFPLLAMVGLLQTVFFSIHLQYVILSRTTLEHKILLDRQYSHLVERKGVYKIPPNQFSYGWYENLRLTLGPIAMIFLPVPVEPSCLMKGT